MRVAEVRIGRRPAMAAGAAAVGVVATAAVTAWLGVEVGVVLLAAGLAAVLAGVAVLLLLLRRQQRTVAAWQAAHAATRAEAAAARAELERLRGTVRELRQTTTVRLAALERDQRRSYLLELVRRAERWREEAGDPPRQDRDVEVSLIRRSNLFDPDFYQSRAGVRTADPVAHYVDVGAALGVDPHPQFPTAGYLERHPDALVTWRTPLAHYLASRRDRAVIVDPPPRADRHGAPDEDDLKWEYLARGLHDLPDTFVLYRIIGNDLPPRHRVGQGRDNLRFVLEHEPDLPGCRKRWVVNRIVDPELERQVIALLEEHGAEYLHIPFDAAAYRAVGWRFHDFELPGFTYRPEFDALTPTDRQRALDVVYHDKNLYVMNNNGARNAALREGRGLAKWVLPWDGNCYLTRQAWDQITEAVTARPHLKYFTVPMARVLDNEVLLRPNPRVDPVEEPQIIFRRDAAEEFDENARYGRCPKVELLRRIGVDGPWEGWCRGRWDAPPKPLSAEAGQVGVAGWVARLYSGERTLERDIDQRAWRRIEAVRDCIDRVDAKLAAERFDPRRPRLLDPTALERQRERWQAGDAELERVVGRLVAAADGLRSGGRHESLGATTEAVAVLGLAGYFTRRGAYLAGCVDVVRTRLLGRRRLDPRRWHGYGLHYLPDLARFLADEAALTPSEVARLRSWLAEHRAWLETSGEAKARRSALDHEGTWYDVIVAALDSYLDDLPGLLATLRRSHERVGQQFEPDGRQLAGRSGVDEQLTNLQGWVTLATFADHVGQDLWSYRTPDGRGLAAVTRATFESVNGRSGGRDPLELDRLEVLAFTVAERLPGAGRRGNPYALRQLYPASSGIRPFWVLGGGADQVAPLTGQRQ